MASRLERLLDRTLRIRPGEGGRVGLMALYAANAIGAVVVGRTVRDALFLAGRGKDDLPLTYILNSVAVAVLSWAYARVADRMRRDRLNAWVAGGWAVAMVGFFGAALLAPRSSALALYVAVEAMGALVVIQFWTFAQDVFNAREAKRLFGLIGAGGQAANVIYGFLASVISARFGAESLLLLCAANLVACGVLSRMVARRYGVQSNTAPTTGTRSAVPVDGQSMRGVVGWRRLFDSPHLVTIAAIAVVSAVAVNLVDYQFKAAAEAQFADRAQLGAFFGRFYGVCGAVALAIQMGVTGRMLERFGILASLLPLPIGLALGSMFSFVLPSGWTASLAKGSDTIFRYTLNDASMQLLYLPVPAGQRGSAKAMVDGMLRPLAGVAAGLLLVALGSVQHLGWQPVGRPDPLTTLLLLGLVGAWVTLLVRGRRQYVSSLLETLRRRKLDLTQGGLTADASTALALEKVLRSDDGLAIHHALELLPQVQGRDFGPVIGHLLEHRLSSVRAAAADHVTAFPDLRHVPILRRRLGDPDPWCVASALGALCACEREKALPEVAPFLRDPRPAIRAAAVVGLVRHGGIEGILEAADELKRLLKGQTRVERELAASVLGSLGVPTFFASLRRFLDDPSPAVRRAALRAAGSLRVPDLFPVVLGKLVDRDTRHDAIDALVHYGPGVETLLGQGLRDPALDPAIRVIVPVVLLRLRTRAAAEALASALAETPPEVRGAACRALVRLVRHRPDWGPSSAWVDDCVWTEIREAESAARDVLALDASSPGSEGRSADAAALLRSALADHRDQALVRVLRLLQLRYPGGGLDAVADSVTGEQAHLRANALEVLDNTLSESFKKRLLPLFEGRTDTLGRSVDVRVRLPQLLRHASPWVAACAAQVLGLDRRMEGGEALEAGLSSPHPLVREACVQGLWRLGLGGQRIEPLVHDPAPTVRRWAVHAIRTQSPDDPSHGEEGIDPAADPASSLLPMPPWLGGLSARISRTS